MARTDARGGPLTRARISQVATGLFLERGFDAVTVAEVARAAGVSSVTVFNHFPRKEDLLLDRADDAVELLRSAVRERAADLDVLESLRTAITELGAERAVLSGLADDSVPFFATVANSPALIARAREIAAELQRVLTDELSDDPGFDGDPGLLPAFLVAGYASVLVEIARRRIAGESPEAIASDHRDRVARLFDALRNGV
jgi:AcrR family transcriptional regulator